MNLWNKLTHLLQPTSKAQPFSSAFSVLHWSAETKQLWQHSPLCLAPAPWMSSLLWQQPQLMQSQLNPLPPHSPFSAQSAAALPPLLFTPHGGPTPPCCQLGLANGTGCCMACPQCPNCTACANQLLQEAVRSLAQLPCTQVLVCFECIWPMSLYDLPLQVPCVSYHWQFWTRLNH